jgi:nitrite reductase/ring-hydroxylating ferredoxin subunit
MHDARGMSVLHLPLDRRGFCRGTCATAIAAAFTACIDQGGVIETGSLGGGPDGNPDDPDSGQHAATPDARPAPDAQPSGPACGASAFDAGTPGTFVAGSPVHFSSHNIYVVRDAGGLFAVSNRCTHEYAVNNVSSGHFHCPRHGANFNYDGSIISGPVYLPLAHYAMCILANGHVGVDASTTTSATTRLNA